MSPRWSVATIFAVHGSISGSLAARMPWIADHVGLAGGGVGKLGYALVMPSIGAILTMPFAGRVVHRLGGRRATLLLLTGWALALTLISFMPTLPTLAVAMFVAGAFAGTADMAMNAEGIAVERQLGRSIMSSLHGGWSIGGFLAGGVGWLLAHNDVSGRVNFIGATVVAIVVAVWACSYLPAQTAAEEEEDDGAPKFALPKGPILIIGLVGFAAIFAEAASADWSAVYLVNRLGAGDATGAVAYAAFAGAMTLGRLTGDAVVRRWGPVPTVRVAGALGVAGGVLIVIAGAAGDSLAAKIAAIGGFALVGIGIAVVVPLAFAAAGHSADSPASRAHAIAGVATVSYGAGLAAPGIVGGIANVTSLTVSFAVVSVLVLVMTLAAPVLRSADLVHAREDEPQSVPA